MYLYSQYFKGYSLLIAIVVIIIITSFSLLLLSYFSINSQLISREKNSIISRYYCLKGFEIAHHERYKYGTEYLENLDAFSLRLYKSQWGVYDIYYSTVIFKNDTLASKISFLGNENDLQDSTALFIRNEDVPVYVSDSVFVAGLLHVPDGKMKNYASDLYRISQSQIRDNSDTSVMSLDITRIAAMVHSLDSLNLEALEDIDENSFENRTILIKDEILEVNKSLRGNLILYAKKITISKGITLDNIIVIANSIVLPDGFKGRLQAFAFDSLIVGRGVQCNYPSVLCVIRDTSISPISRDNHSVFLVEDSLRLLGEIYVLGDNEDGRLPLLEIKGISSNIEGSIYTNGSVLFSGDLTGSIRCNKLLNRSKGIINQNLLKDIMIDRLGLPQYFGFSLLNIPRDHAKHLRKICWLKK